MTTEHSSGSTSYAPRGPRERLEPRMIDGMPWAAQVGFAGGGWALAFTFMWMVFAGRVATTREIREKNQRIEFLQQAVSERDKQVSLLMGETIPVTSSVLSALHRAVEEGGEQ